MEIMISSDSCIQYCINMCKVQGRPFSREIIYLLHSSIFLLRDSLV
jgi:hypothetical protein